MNPDNQKPTNPDYSFITSQPELAAKHKNNKKVVILIVSLVLLLLSLVAMVVFGSEKNLQNTATTVEKASVVRDFLAKVKSNDIAGAYSLLNENEITREDFEKQSVPFLQKMKLDECKPKTGEETLTDGENRLTARYTCYSTKNNFEFEYDFMLDGTDVASSKQIVYFNLVDAE